ncbi:MAG TPA: hypothetical protein VIZ69_06285 [Thermoanaerobaculia bacterium]
MHQQVSVLVQDARAWASGRSRLWRIPLLIYFAWSGLRRFSDPLRGDFFSGITLGIHELGHLLLAWGGPVLSIPAGSAAQVAAPAVAGWLLWRQRDYFGVTVAGAWLASSLHGLAAYVGDARARELPLVALTSEPIHDWNWILGKIGILSWDQALAALLRIASFGIWVASIAAGTWLCVQMVKRGSRPAPTS